MSLFGCQRIICPSIELQSRCIANPCYYHVKCTQLWLKGNNTVIHTILHCVSVMSLRVRRSVKHVSQRLSIMMKCPKLFALAGDREVDIRLGLCHIVVIFAFS